MNIKMLHCLITLACFVIGTWLLILVLSLPHQSVGLSRTVAESMPRSGVTHPVTAVLLNFRGYDTLLEIGVLLLVLISTWSLQPAGEEDTSPAGQVQSAYLLAVIPVLVVYAGYLLWIGSKGPGGAFQAGAILAGAAILLRISHLPAFKESYQFATRAMLCAGFGSFLLVAFGLLLTGRGVLEYPPEKAGALMLMIETAGTLSIGMALYGMFVGGRWPLTKKPEK